MLAIGVAVLDEVVSHFFVRKSFVRLGNLNKPVIEFLEGFIRAGLDFVGMEFNGELFVVGFDLLFCKRLCGVRNRFDKRGPEERELC